eukprot:220313-Prymnesium_polylepis.1
MHGRTDFYGDKGKTIVRSEYDGTHSCHGIIDCFGDGEFVRTEYAPTHERHGCIDARNKNLNAPTHKNNGEIIFGEG